MHTFYFEVGSIIIGVLECDGEGEHSEVVVGDGRKAKGNDENSCEHCSDWEDLRQQDNV